jgi:hypothetical protein
VVPTSTITVSPGSTNEAAGGSPVHPVQQALLAQPAQVAADRLDRYAELAGQLVGGHGAVLAHLGQDRLAPLYRQHRAP